MTLKTYRIPYENACRTGVCNLPIIDSHEACYCTSGFATTIIWHHLQERQLILTKLLGKDLIARKISECTILAPKQH